MAQKSEVGRGRTPVFGVLQARSRNGYADGTDMRPGPSPDRDKEILAHFLYGSTDLESTFRNFDLESFHRNKTLLSLGTPTGSGMNAEENLIAVTLSCPSPTKETSTL